MIVIRGLGIAILLASLSPLAGAAGKQPPKQKYPPQPIPQSQMAKARLDQAKDILKRAEEDVKSTGLRLKGQFEESPEMRAIADEQKKLQEELDAAKKTLAASLQSKPEYKAAADARRQADEDIQNLRSNNGDQAEITAAAAKASRAAGILTRLENEAADANPQAGKLKDRIAENARKLAELRRKFIATLDKKPEMKEAKAAVDKARKNVAEAQKAFTAADAKDQQALADWKAKCQDIDNGILPPENAKKPAKKKK